MRPKKEASIGEVSRQPNNTGIHSTEINNWNKGALNKLLTYLLERQSLHGAPEVHNMSQHGQGRTKPCQWMVQCTNNFDKIGHSWEYPRSQTDRQTDTQTYHNSPLPRGRVKVQCAYFTVCNSSKLTEALIQKTKNTEMICEFATGHSLHNLDPLGHVQLHNTLIMWGMFVEVGFG